MNRIIVRALAAIVAAGDSLARVAGDEFEISADDFDATLHAFVSVVAQGDGNRGLDLEALGTQIGAALAPALEESFGNALREAGAGRVNAPAVAGTEGGNRTPAGSGARAVPSWAAAHRYLRLSEAEQSIRSPDTDQAIADYLRCMVDNDRAGQSEALERCDGPTVARSEHERAALAIGAAATGGNIVPTPMAAVIVERRQNMEVIGPRSRQFRSMNQALDVPTNATLMTAAVFAEAAAITETDPTFGSVALSKKKVATATRSSRELLQFTPFDLVGQVGDLAAAAIAIRFGLNDADGTGFTDSIMNSSATTVVDASVGALAVADMRALFYGIPSRYRAGAVWLMNEDSIQLNGSLLEDGRQWFEAKGATPMGLGGGQGGTPAGSILGHAVLEENGIPGLSSAEIAFGNLQYYGVLDDEQMRVEASLDAAFLADQILWKFVAFRDGGVLQGEAFAVSRGITG